jgi:hypothetical protein
MKTKILAITGLILGIIPVYTLSGWIFVFNSHPNHTQTEKQTIYAKQILFDLKAFDTILLPILTILSGIVSVAIFSILLFKLSQIQDKNLSQTLMFILYLIVIIIVGLFTVLNLWGLL